MIIAVYFSVMAALAAFLVWRAADRIWDYLVIAALTIAAFSFVATRLTGDMSRYLPENTFSEGADGKDQIIIVSALSTILVAVMLAAVFWLLVKTGWRLIRRAP